jgi:protein gp37
MSNIEWTDQTWNPVIGCTPVSPGCLNCYAATMANRMQGMPNQKDYAPKETRLGEAGHPKTIRIAEVKGGRAWFTGEVRCLEHRLTDPLKWKKPRRVFVNSMSDLFHEAVSFEFVAACYATMAACNWHTFQVLTKRPERAAEFYRWMEDGNGSPQRKMVVAIHYLIGGRAPSGSAIVAPAWPLHNVWLGASVENQPCADERIPHLLKCPAAVRFLSVEPLLGAVDLGLVEIDSALEQRHAGVNGRIDWVIVGGESGSLSKIRACEVGWIRSIVTQCKDAGVPCFVKQLGSKPMLGDVSEPHGWPTSGGPVDWETGRIYLKDRKGGDPAEWQVDLQVREWPRVGGGA